MNQRPQVSGLLLYLAELLPVRSKFDLSCPSSIASKFPGINEKNYMLLAPLVPILAKRTDCACLRMERLVYLLLQTDAPHMNVSFGPTTTGRFASFLRQLPEHCRRSPATGCRAFTYNSRHNACFLKEDGTLLVTNADAISGYDRTLAANITDTGFIIAADMDSPGGDYKRIRQSNFIGCIAGCALEWQCRAFAYVR